VDWLRPELLVYNLLCNLQISDIFLSTAIKTSLPACTVTLIKGQTDREAFSIGLTIPDACIIKLIIKSVA